MPEVRILPNGLKPVTAEAAVYADGKNPPLKRPKILGMRIGEIIRGSVLDVINETLLRISFPFGVVNAAIQARLIPGDSLFFIVDKIEPSLVIRIHSVTIRIFEEELGAEEISRVLNVDDSPFGYLVISRLKKKFSSILREDLIKLIGFKNHLSENELKYFSEENVADILSEMLYLGADLNRNNFLKFSKILLKPIDLRKVVNYLLDFAGKNSGNSSELFKKLNHISSASLSPIDRIQIFLNRELPHSKEFFICKNIIEQINVPASAKELDKTLMNALKIMYQVIDSQSSYNFRAYLCKSVLSFYMLYSVSNAYYIAQILLPFNDIKNKNIKLNLEYFGEDFISDKFKNNQPILMYFEESHSETLNNLMPQLSRSLESEINYLFPKADFNANYAQASSGFSIVM